MTIGFNSEGYDSIIKSITDSSWFQYCTWFISPSLCDQWTKGFLMMRTDTSIFFLLIMRTKGGHVVQTCSSYPRGRGHHSVREEEQVWKMFLNRPMICRASMSCRGRESIDQHSSKTLLSHVAHRPYSWCHWVFIGIFHIDSCKPCFSCSKDPVECINYVYIFFHTFFFTWESP